MQDNDDNGHRTPLRWPPRVGRRQWKPRGGQPNEQSGMAHSGNDQRPRDSTDRPVHDTGGPQHERAPIAKQPHERDESVDKVGVPEVRTKLRKTIERAHDDLASGHVDTDLRGHMHETYGRLRRKPNPTR